MRQLINLKEDIMEKKIPYTGKHLYYQNAISGIFLIIFIYLSATGKPQFYWGEYGSFIIGGICAVIAFFKFRNPFAWFVAGTWGVLIILIILLFQSSLHGDVCPNCKRKIAIGTTMCPFCSNSLKT